MRSTTTEGDAMMLLLAPHVRPIDCADATSRQSIEKLLDFLPVLYPGGSAWLSRRMDDVAMGRATALVAEVLGEVVGVALGILKPRGRFKVSTLFVSPPHQGHGLGAELLDSMLWRARVAGANEVYITGAHSVRENLSPLLVSRGFVLTATEANRYGQGRHEDVYSLTF